MTLNKPELLTAPLHILFCLMKSNQCTILSLSADEGYICQEEYNAYIKQYKQTVKTSVLVAYLDWKWVDTYMYTVLFIVVLIITFQC